MSDKTDTIPAFGNKRDVAKLIGCCLRSVDHYMDRGCPHYKLGYKSVRFDLGEVRDWVKQKHKCIRGVDNER